MLKNIRIVLVQTSHPGNIGSTARAMKTMGLSRLYLVAPKLFPHAKAIELASSADDVLATAVVTASLEEALQDCQLVIGSSTRPRGIALPALNPRQCGEQVVQEGQQGDVAIVFGREDSGLTNEELLHCHFHVAIPSNPDYSSLNLAAAVQVICYEIRVASLSAAALSQTQLFELQHDDFASAEEVEGFYVHLKDVLIQIDFLRPDNPKRLMPRLRRLFNRIRLEKTEIRILRGILTAITRNPRR